MVIGDVAVPCLFTVISELALYVPLARMMISPATALLMAVCRADNEVTVIVAAVRLAGIT
jgi:hypothetical protein